MSHNAAGLRSPAPPTREVMTLWKRVERMNITLHRRLWVCALGIAFAMLVAVAWVWPRPRRPGRLRSPHTLTI